MKATGSEVFLVGVQMEWSSDPEYPINRGTLEFLLHQKLPRGILVYETGEQIEFSWWIAEDERGDRSDCDSAVFVPAGMTQEEARLVLENHMKYKQFFLEQRR